VCTLFFIDVLKRTRLACAESGTLWSLVSLYLHLVCLHMLLCKWLDINRMCQVHLYPLPFIQIFIRKNTLSRRFDRYFCTLSQLTCKLVQTFARMSLEIYLSSSLFPCWPPSNSSSTLYVHPILYTYAPPSSLFIRRCFSYSHLKYIIYNAIQHSI